LRSTRANRRRSREAAFSSRPLTIRSSICCYGLRFREGCPPASGRTVLLLPGGGGLPLPITPIRKWAAAQVSLKHRMKERSVRASVTAVASHGDKTRADQCVQVDAHTPRRDANVSAYRADGWPAKPQRARRPSQVHIDNLRARGDAWRAQQAAR